MTAAPSKIRFFAGQPMTGIVHVGANDGEEIPDYLELGLVPVLAIEPNPLISAKLTADYAADGRVSVISCALGSRNDEVTLHIPGHLHDTWELDVKSASILRPNRTSGYEWGERHRIVHDVTVPLRRFDSLGLDVSPYNTLVVDVEGMEMEVLLGFGELLAGFRFLSIECSLEPIFTGQTPAEVISGWLAQKGFERRSPLELHNDCFWSQS